MKIILSNQCESLTGSLGSGFGYSIQRQRKGFFSKRNSKGKVPPDGHWRFIVACAELAKNGLHIADVQVLWMELSDALYEAGHFVANYKVCINAIEKAKLFYNAADIINLKITFGI
jgi:hypothetical protein